MASEIQHSDITDDGRHEPKGASTALEGQILTSNGDGTTTFKTAPDYSLTTDVVLHTTLNDTQYLTQADEVVGMKVGEEQVSPDGSVSIVGEDEIVFNEPGTYRVEITACIRRGSPVGVNQIWVTPKLTGIYSPYSGTMLTLDSTYAGSNQTYNQIIILTVDEPGVTITFDMTTDKDVFGGIGPSSFVGNVDGLAPSVNTLVQRIEVVL